MKRNCVINANVAKACPPPSNTKFNCFSSLNNKNAKLDRHKLIFSFYSPLPFSPQSQKKGGNIAESIPYNVQFTPITLICMVANKTLHLIPVKTTCARGIHLQRKPQLLNITYSFPALSN